MQTKRLNLRHWTTEDAADLYEQAKNPEVGPITGWPPHQSVEESLNIIKNVLNGPECYAICFKEDNIPIGDIELRLNGRSDLVNGDDECELGYWLGRPFWGQGIMPEAARELIRHAFEDLGMNKIWCGYYDGNYKSKRVQEKLGFTYQWTTPDVDVPMMHEKRIGHVNLLTKEEWLKKQEKKQQDLKEQWLQEEAIAHIHGWDFSHIHGRYTEDGWLPWDYKEIIQEYLKDDMMLLDYDTGGGEFLLSLHHPSAKTAATEGYVPNVTLCKEVLLPLGIDFKECGDCKHIPFPDASFDVIINRHGDFYPPEIMRLLKPGGIFVTQQVGDENDRELVEMVLPGTPMPFPGLNLKTQREEFLKAGFDILEDGEAFLPIRFYDVGAFVWFARIIEWEFPGFSVERCLPKLFKMQEIIETDGYVEGTTHRYLIVAQKPEE